MSNNGRRPVEDEFRSSQVYKTLTGVGIPMAEKIAQGLGKAVEGIDHAINNASSPGKQPSRPNGGYYQRYQQGPAGPQGQPAPTNKVPPQYRPVPPAYKPPQRNRQYPHTAQTAPPTQRQPSPWPQSSRRPAGVNPAPPPQMPQMKMVRRGSPVKFYLTGIAALLYAMTGPLYEPVHFVGFSLLLVLVFLLSGALFKGKKEFVPLEPEKPKAEPKPEPKPAQEEKKSKTGNPEVDKLIDEGNEALKKLRAANNAIPDEALTEDITRMERASADIFRFIGDHPEKAPQIRKFMNYYLPTTLKLLNSYQRLSQQSVKGENITSTMFNIAGMMHTVADAFEKQLDSLFTDEAMDISADITVFETMLKQEGFVEEKGSR